MASNGNKIRRAGRKVLARSRSAVARIALAVDQTLVAATPVDTGLARSNWQTSLRTPKQGTVVNRGGGVALAEAANIAVQFTRQTGEFQSNTIFIVNNLDYIDELNRGSSLQAPSGFVEMAVAAGFSRARRG